MRVCADGVGGMRSDFTETEKATPELKEGERLGRSEIASVTGRVEVVDGGRCVDHDG